MSPQPSISPGNQAIAPLATVIQRPFAVSKEAAQSAEDRGAASLIWAAIVRFAHLRTTPRRLEGEGVPS